MERRCFSQSSKRGIEATTKTVNSTAEINSAVNAASLISPLPVGHKDKSTPRAESLLSNRLAVVAAGINSRHAWLGNRLAINVGKAARGPDGKVTRERQSSTAKGVATTEDARFRKQQAIRILMIEEEVLVRAALVALITSWEGFDVVAEAATKVEALEQFRRFHPDVVLLSLAGTEDATLVPEISRACGRTRLLVLFGHCPEDLRLVMTGLAKRVVAKTENPKELKKAILEIYGKV